MGGGDTLHDNNWADGPTEYTPNATSQVNHQIRTILVGKFRGLRLHFWTMEYTVAFSVSSGLSSEIDKC